MLGSILLPRLLPLCRAKTIGAAASGADAGLLG